MEQFIHRKFPDSVQLKIKDGEILFREGDSTRELYIVNSGAVKIVRTKNGREITIATIHRGEFVGEMSLLESLPRSATAIAVGDTSLQVIEPGGFLIKIRRDPTFAFEMMQTLSRRIRHTNEKLIDLMKHENLGKDSLENVVVAAEFADQSEAPVQSQYASNLKAI